MTAAANGLAREQPQSLRPDVVAALREQPRLYVAAAAAIARASRPGQRGSGRWAPPIPINPAVHDLLVDAEWTALQLNGRFRLVLGYSLPWGRLRDACPWCGMWSLVHKADDGVIRCGNPDCRTPDDRPPIWRGRAGWLELAALLGTSPEGGP